MKKLIAIALTLLVLLSTAGCVTLETQLLQARIDEREASILSSEQLNVYSMKITAGDWQLERIGYVEIQNRAMGGDVNYATYNALVIDNDIPNNFVSYQDDAYTYFVHETGETYKRANVRDEGSVEALFEELGAGLVDRAIVSDLPEGGKKITYIINTAAANEGVGDYINAYIRSIILDVESAKLTDLRYTMYVDETYLTYYYSLLVKANLVFDDGDEGVLEYDSSFETISINSVDTIEFPAGYQDFPDISEY